MSNCELSVFNRTHIICICSYLAQKLRTFELMLSQILCQEYLSYFLFLGGGILIILLWVCVYSGNCLRFFCVHVFTLTAMLKGCRALVFFPVNFLSCNMFSFFWIVFLIFCSVEYVKIMTYYHLFILVIGCLKTIDHNWTLDTLCPLTENGQFLLYCLRRRLS